VTKEDGITGLSVEQRNQIAEAIGNSALAKAMTVKINALGGTGIGV